jgi:hypothetical protein
MVVQMISVGESTGALDSMLSKIADFFDDEVDAAVGVNFFIRTLLMVFLEDHRALVVAMYLPIFQMALSWEADLPPRTRVSEKSPEGGRQIPIRLPQADNDLKREHVY